VRHSCGHRSCRHCQHLEFQVRRQLQLQLLVSASYFIVTPKLPAELRGLAFS